MVEPVGDQLQELEFLEDTNTTLIRLRKSQKDGKKHTSPLVPSVVDMPPPRLSYDQTGGLEGVRL